MKLYYHKTDGGAEYLTDKYVKCPDGTKEGVLENARYIVRIDGDIRRDAELTVKTESSDLLEACRACAIRLEYHTDARTASECRTGEDQNALDAAQAAIAKAQNGTEHKAEVTEIPDTDF